LVSGFELLLYDCRVLHTIVSGQYCYANTAELRHALFIVAVFWIPVLLPAF